MKKERKEILSDELRHLDSSLDMPGKMPGYQVPEHYFDRLPADIQQKIAEKSNRSTMPLPLMAYRRLVPVLGTLVLLAAVVMGVILMRSNGFDDHMAAADTPLEWTYFATENGYDRVLLYDLVIDSDLSAEEILFGMDTFTASTDKTFDDDILEEIFENAQYYGIEAGFLLSSLD